MIQAASVGIGIVGKEGKQASLAADFSITQVRSRSIMGLTICFSFFLSCPHCKDTIPKILNKYYQKRNCLFCCRKICGPILLGICKSLTDT
jgi:hypothetical protein